MVNVNYDGNVYVFKVSISMLASLFLLNTKRNV